MTPLLRILKKIQHRTLAMVFFSPQNHLLLPLNVPLVLKILFLKVKHLKTGPPLLQLLLQKVQHPERVKVFFLAKK